MSDSDIDEMESLDELALLKQRADLMGIGYSSRIGLEALKAKIERKMNDLPEEAVSASPVAPRGMSKADKEAKLRDEIQKEGLKLIRLRITNLNPNKKDLHGEIFTVANRYLGIVKKFIPYGEVTDGGYHVPNVLYEQLKTRRFLSIRTRRDQKTGEQIVDQNWVPEFALEVLPQLTEAEIAKLAAAQAAAGGVN